MVEQVKARADLPAVDLVARVAPLADPLEADLVVPLEVDPAVAQRLRVAEVPEDRAAPAAREVPVAPLVAPLAVDAGPRRTPLSIPRMAKFPTQWLLARSPTT